MCLHRPLQRARACVHTLQDCGRGHCLQLFNGHHTATTQEREPRLLYRLCRLAVCSIKPTLLASRKSRNVMHMFLSIRYHTRQSHMARAARCCLPCKTAHRPATPGEEDRMRVAPVGWRRWACQRGYRLLCFAAEAHTMAVTLSCMIPYR